MSIEEQLQEQGILKSTMNGLSGLSGEDLIIAFNMLKSTVDIDDKLPNQEQYISFIKKHLKHCDIAHVLLTIYPSVDDILPFCHTMEDEEADGKLLYIMAYDQYKKSVQGGEGQDYDSILKLLEDAISVLIPNNNYYSLEELSSHQLLWAFRSATLMGDILFKQKKWNDAYDEYTFALLLLEHDIPDHPQERVRIMSHSALSQWYMGEHTGAQELLTDIIVEEIGINSYDNLKEYMYHDIIHSLRNRIYLVMIELDKNKPDYEGVQYDLTAMENIINYDNIPDDIKHMYYFCQGWYYAAPVLQGECDYIATEYFGMLPIDPFLEYINQRKSGKPIRIIKEKVIPFYGR